MGATRSNHGRHHLARPGFVLAAAVLFASQSLSLVPARAQAAVTVTVDSGIVSSTSNFSVGATHMQASLDPWGDPDAIARGKDLLRASVSYQNQPMMGNGALNPWPDPNVTDPASWNWSRLDQRVQLMRDTGAVKTITFWRAPTWMVDPTWYLGKYPDETDWSRPEDPPLTEHEDDFAYLAQQVALRYPDVQYFLVWNELKGMWNASANNWDYVRYTRLYNKVWNAVKAVRPDAKIGGPYLALEGSGGAQDLGLPSAWYTASPITDRNRQVLTYWLANKVGADFVALDRSAPASDTNWASYPEDKRIKLTHWFGDAVVQTKLLPGYHGEPIWYAEDYVWRNEDAYQPSVDYMAAALASTLLSEAKAGVAVSLRWEPQQQPGKPIRQNLFTDTTIAGGGQPTPAETVYRFFKENFGPGTQFVRTTSSSPDVEVLASGTKTLLVNKTNTVETVDVNASLKTLLPYEVNLSDTPPDTTPPVATITAPLPGATVPRDTNVTIRANVVDNIRVARTEFWVNGALLCTDVTSPYECAWRVPNLRRTAFTVMARGFDGAGNVTSQSEQVQTGK